MTFLSKPGILDKNTPQFYFPSFIHSMRSAMKRQGITFRSRTPIGLFLNFLTIFFILFFSLSSIRAEESDHASLLLSDFSADSLNWYDVSGGGMELSRIPEGLRIATNFTEYPNTERVSIDAKVNLDLTSWNQFEVEAALSNPKIFTSASIYFHSGKGWYSCSAGVPTAPGQKIRFSKSDFHTEEEPAGWDKIDTIRLSFWRMGKEESTVIFSSLKCVAQSILFVSVLNTQGEERWVGKNNASILSKKLRDLGIDSDRVSVPQKMTAEAWEKTLEKRSILVINHTMHLLPETRDFLLAWAEKNQTSVHFLNEDIRENPNAFNEFLDSLAKSPKAKKQIEKNSADYAVTVLNQKIKEADKVKEKIAQIFKTEGLIAGIRFCEEIHQKYLERAVNQIDTDKSMKFRAWWNHSGLGAYPGDWTRTAKELKAAGFTAVIPNMLWVGEALYPSQYAPTSANYEKYGDQMEQCVKACHAEGLEVHVWRVCFNAKWHISPELFAKYENEGRFQKSSKGETLPWLCPSHPANIELETNTMIELADKYDVDGIHFDYIRFDGNNGCFCERCRKQFEQESGKNIKNWPRDITSGDRKKEFQEWRATLITNIVKRVHDKMEEKHPNVKISAAVFSAYPASRYGVGQDWVLWAQKGYVDFLCPMNYTLNAATFENISRNQQELVPEGFPLYFGIGEWKLSPDETMAQIQKADQLNARGFTIFDLSERSAQRILPPLTPQSPHPPQTNGQ